MIHDYPGIAQRRSYDCGRAVAEGVLVYFGHDPKIVRKAMQTTPLDGTHPGGLSGFLRQQRLGTIVGNPFTLDDLRWQTRKGRPVLCLVQRGTCGHWLTVLGVKSNRVHFHDPADGWKSETTLEFESRWWDNDADGEHFVRRGIAVHST